MKENLINQNQFNKMQKKHMSYETKYGVPQDASKSGI